MKGARKRTDLPEDARDEHPNNPAARRSPNGIWNEAELPVTEWESPEHRIVLPIDLMALMESPPVLRVSKAKRDQMIGKRASDASRIDRTGEALAAWEYAGRQRNAADSITWAVVYEDHGRKRLAVFGPDNTGSWNLITSHVVRGNQLTRIMEQPGIVQRGEE